MCKHEQENIIAICPLWALNKLKQKKLAILKDEALLNKRYSERWKSLTIIKEELLPMFP